MKINLKQPEITVALREYITKHGLNLANKNVSITFTAGRGETGLSADIIIVDSPVFPDFGADTETPVKAATPKPVLSVVVAPAAIPVEQPAEPVYQVEPEPAVIETEVTPVTAKTASLFN